MPADALKCKECQTTYPLEARYVCDRCFGPLEVAYAPLDLDPGGAQAPHPGGPAHAVALRGLPAPGGHRPLGAAHGLDAARASADRLAARLGLGEVWVKNETANPTHSFKDRVVSVALARAQELGFQTIACASTGNLANAVAAHAAAAGLPAYVLIPADLEEAKILATGRLRRQRGRDQGQLRRRQPALHRAGRRPRRLGVRQRQRAALLRRGLQDARLRGRRAARLGAARPRRRAGRLRARCSRRSRARSRSGSTAGCSRASCRR